MTTTIAWTFAIISVLGAAASVYFALDSQVTWWTISGQHDKARRLDRFLRGINRRREEWRP